MRVIGPVVRGVIVQGLRIHAPHHDRRTGPIIDGRARVVVGRARILAASEVTAPVIGVGIGLVAHGIGVRAATPHRYATSVIEDSGGVVVVHERVCAAIEATGVIRIGRWIFSGNRTVVDRMRIGASDVDDRAVSVVIRRIVIKLWASSVIIIDIPIAVCITAPQDFT